MRWLVNYVRQDDFELETDNWELTGRNQMLSIRMRRAGSKKRAYYRVVVTEGRNPREGSFVEILGTYNPRTKPATVEIDRERVNHWIKQGARPSDSVRTLLKRHLTKDRGAVAQPPSDVTPSQA
jgi:small subunit ribosomal protein S16